VAVTGLIAVPLGCRNFCEGWNATLSDCRARRDRFEAAKLESVFVVPGETVELDAIIRPMD
jgi:hypothetical protein